MTQSSNTQFRFSWASLLLIFVLPLLSGAAALSHELLWTRRLVDLLGATDWVIGRVLGLFFLGLSIGGYLATRLPDDQKPPIGRICFAELAIGLLSLPAAFLPAWTDWIWAAMGTSLLVSWPGAAIKLLLGGVVILPPAIAMGFTLPLFIRAATSLGGRLATVGIWIYGFNTLGGVIGLWATSTWLLQALGAQWTMLTVAAVNIFIAAVAWTIRKTGNQPTLSRQMKKKLQREAKKKQTELTTPTNQNVNDQPSSSLQELIVLSFCSGFIVLSLEVLLLRLIALVVPNSYHTTSALLANVIFILAISSFAVSFFNWFTQKKVARQSIVICGLLTSAVCLAFAPVIMFQQTDQLISLRYLQGLNGHLIESVNHYWMLTFWLVAATGGAALLFSGFVFPALLTINSENDPDGKRIGYLLAINGVGGLVGAELYNSLFLQVLGIYQSFTLLAATGILVGGGLLLRRSRTWGAVVSIACVMILLFSASQCQTIPYLSTRTKTKFEIDATEFGRDGVLQIVKDDHGAKNIILNNQYMLGGTGALMSQRRQLLLPWLLKPDARRVCCLGLATGISASGLESVHNPPAVTAVELSAQVEQMARSHFANETSGFFNRTDNCVIIEDARTFMAAASEQYDLIVADLYRPHGAGEGRLYSIEHFQNIRQAMTEDGLFCQWLPAYQLNEDNFLVIAATFQKVFPDALVVYANADLRFPVIGLLGWKNDRLWQADSLQQKLDAIPESIRELDPFLNSARRLFVGRLDDNQLANVPINTLDNLQVEIAAGNHWILKDLRSDRKRTYETELITGKYILEFNGRLKKFTKPLFDAKHFQEFNYELLNKINGDQ